MASILKFILSGMIGGIVVFTGLQYTKDKTIEQKQEQTVTFTNFNSSAASAAFTTVDFVESAKKSTGAVVHIYAEESEQLVRQKREEQRNKRRDPFQDFFGFDDFFGSNFYRPKNGSGSGVFYSKEGYIITNNHVVGFADEIRVTDSNGKEYKAKKIGVDKTTDLAVIQIEPSGNISPIKFADSDQVKVGEWVLAVGNPFGYLTSTVTAGIVSAKGRNLDIIKGEKAIEDFIQTDAAINPGNSGGALVNLNGDLIGINTAIATPTGVFAGYSFAIPSNIVKKVVSDIVQQGSDIERTSLGVGGYDVNEELVKEFNLKVPSNTGFYVEEVEKKSAAQMSGLLPGDVITSINSVTIKNYEDIELAMKYAKVGDNLKLKVYRNGKELTIPVQLRKSF
ncbi:MAG: trypsin-like peptidase domain-containing protein [Saprospiraceae bacterium]|nr:trypsin-like peptidase domain-containing protein [Saprospiraceae bacterium]